MLIKQSPTQIDLVSQIFYLSEQEKQLLLSANVGEGLFFAGQSHVAMKVVSAPFEHKLITSDPEEILKMRRDAETEASRDALQTAPPIQPTAQEELVRQFSAPLETPPQVTDQTPPTPQPSLDQTDQPTTDYNS